MAKSLIPRHRALLLLLILTCSSVAAQSAIAPPPTGSSAAAQRDDAAVQLPGVYRGRVIAQTMHYLGAEWLIRDNREQEERCSLMLTNLGVKLGMTICDMGCGNGFYTTQLAQMVGPRGKVVGVDIQPEMLKMLQRRAQVFGVTNVIPLLGTPTDPKLPAGQFDLILCVDVYHEFAQPEPMLAAMRQALKPDGVVALVEYREEDPRVPIKPEHKMSKSQILKEWLPNGFKLVREFDGLPWQHLMFFAREENGKQQ